VIHPLKGAVVGLALAGAIATGNSYRCYEYEASHFVVPRGSAFERVILAVPREWPRDEMHPLVLLFLDRGGRYRRMDQYLVCRWKETSGRYRCSGECDAGMIWLDRTMTLQLASTDRLELDEGDERSSDTGVDGREKRVQLRFGGTDRLKGRRVACPPCVERLYDSGRDGDGSDPLLFVCYRRKTTKNNSFRYEGCQLSARPCDAIGRKHFGHDENQDASYEDFLRCVDSAPRSR